MAQNPREVWVIVNGERFLVKVEDLNQNPVVAFVDGSRFEVVLDQEGSVSAVAESPEQLDRQVHSVPAGTSCQVTAPMPGDIVEILVRLGQAVKTGDPLCVLDAMKMKNTIHAPQDGSIAEICVSEGQCVEYGTPMFRLG
jgi:biotin carboxyl carrier protein